MHLETIKEKIRYSLNESVTRWGVAIKGAIALLILLSAVLFALQTYPLPEPVQVAIGISDRCILALFTIEYLLRLWSANHRLQFVFSLYGLIDLLAILPFIFGFIDTRFLRLMRWLRILRLARFFEEKTWFGKLSGYEGLIFARILFTLFAIIFIYAGAIYQAEHAANSENFVTFLDAVYFAVVTMTTVGFGDITPVSEAGRGLTIMMILTGIALIPTQVGKLIQQFTKVRSAVRIACENCGLMGHEADAKFCRQCGTALPKPQRAIPASPSGPDSSAIAADTP
ncbi:MAG: ion transporter [Phormidesmis sp. RL_2_1]|nr:ion transporter [Phormidesmis sp. RL_2_1]